MWPEGDESLSCEAVEVIDRILVRKISDRYGAEGTYVLRYYTHALKARGGKTERYNG